MRLQKGKYGCSFLEGPPVVMGHHDTMLLHINTVLILMASFYRVGKNRAPSYDTSQFSCRTVLKPDLVLSLVTKYPITHYTRHFLSIIA